MGVTACPETCACRKALLLCLLATVSHIGVAQLTCDDTDPGTCTALLGMGKSCDFDIHDLITSEPQGTLMDIVCPSSCENCAAVQVPTTAPTPPAPAPGIPPPPPSRPTPTPPSPTPATVPTALPTPSPPSDPCADDPQCVVLKTHGCEQDIGQYSSRFDRGTLVSTVCPGSCAPECQAGYVAPSGVSDLCADTIADCANILLTFACSHDLSHHEGVPADSTVEDVCPMQCTAACSAGSASPGLAPSPPAGKQPAVPSDVYASPWGEHPGQIIPGAFATGWRVSRV